MKNYDTIEALFHAVADEQYVVLRNFESLREDIAGSAHPDIDFLCADRAAFLRKLGAKPRTLFCDGMHYKVTVEGREVSVDLRCIGDGYLDPSWERSILDNRGLYEGLCYVPDEENASYSLLYHALIQKKKIAPDYLKKLETLILPEAKTGENCDSCIEAKTDRSALLQVLEQFMMKKGYRYTYPENPMGIFYLEGTDSTLLENDPKKKYVRKVAQLLKRKK